MVLKDRNCNKNTPNLSPQSIIIIKILLYSYLFTVVLLIDFSCTQQDPPDLSCTTNKLSFHLIQPAEDITIQPGNLDFEVDAYICDRFFNANTWLSVLPKGPNSYQVDGGDWRLPDNTLHTSHTYSYNFTQPGVYDVWVGLGDDTHQKPNYYVKTEIRTITVTGNVQRDFRIQELSMVGDDLWPDYYGPGINFNGVMKRDGCFEEANTVITVISNLPISIG